MSDYDKLQPPILHCWMVSKFPFKTAFGDSSKKRNPKIKWTFYTPKEKCGQKKRRLYCDFKPFQSLEMEYADGFDLSERALAYGLRMLKASNGKASNSVKTENAYEKNLLKEVCHSTASFVHNKIAQV